MPPETQEAHGGNIYRASELLNKREEDILDFSANINPLGIPEALKEALLSNMDSLARYPDPEYARLRRKLSEYVDLPVENIVVGNGSSEVIFLALKVLKPENILIPAPCFSEYERASAEAGISPRFLELREEEGFRLNAERLMGEIASGAKCVLLCNPNNPTSTLASIEEMLRILKLAFRSGTAVIVDEAFIELTLGGSGNSVAGYVREFGNLFVIRAFTKTFAVPGLRLGYGLGNKNLAERMRLLQQPWPVNNLAACAGDFLPGAGEYLKRTEAWLKAEKEWLRKSLGAIPGLRVFEPQTNFVLARLTDKGMDAEKLRAAMAQRGVLIRNASGFRFLDRHYIRLAVRDRPENEILIHTMKGILQAYAAT